MKKRLVLLYLLCTIFLSVGGVMVANGAENTGASEPTGAMPNDSTPEKVKVVSGGNEVETAKSYPQTNDQKEIVLPLLGVLVLGGGMVIFYKTK